MPNRATPTLPAMPSGLEQILRESCVLMAEKGFHGTTMRDISHATGRSLSGLYYYFNNKQELLYLINQHCFTRVQHTLDAMLGVVDSAHDRLYAAIYNHLAFFTSHNDELRVILLGTRGMTGPQAQSIRDLKEAYDARLRQLVASAYAERHGVAADPRELARWNYLLFGMMNWIFSWYEPQRHGALEDLVESTYCTFVSGFGREETGALQRRRLDRVLRAHRPAPLWTDHHPKGAQGNNG